MSARRSLLLSLLHRCERAGAHQLRMRNGAHACIARPPTLHLPPAACRAAAAAACSAALPAQPALQLPAAAQAQARLLHRCVTTLPSLMGWQPPAAAPQAAAQLGRAALPPALRQQQRAAALSTLSDSIRITPAIEAQLERILQRHAELLEQLSGEAMSK